MHTFGVWYFEWGWIVMTLIVLAVVAGTHRSKQPKVWISIAITLSILFGAIAFYWKHLK